MNLDDALNTFVIESRELLENMEAALLQIEQAPDDPDLINAVFRAAHTIKGSAGLFGLDYLVTFTHSAENVLDQVRGGSLAMSGDLVAVFLAVCDHIATLVDHLADGSEVPAETHGRSDELITRLKAAAGETPTVTPVASLVEEETPLIREGGENGA